MKRSGVRFLIWVAVVFVWSGAPPVKADPAMQGMDVRALQTTAADLFGPSIISGTGSPFSEATERALLLFQAVSVLVIVGAMIVKVRSDSVQMEGIAAMMLKVAFIATIPFWRTLVVETADTLALAIGPSAASAATSSSHAITGLWDMLGQWAPPSTPALDSLQTQSAANVPTSGDEAEWALQAWNWAGGLGSGVGDQFDAVWQAFAGGLRAVIVTACCAAMTCLVAATILLNYLGELLRCLLLSAGWAVAPVFIAGLGVDTLRPLSSRCIIKLVTVACWPVGWAIANVVTVSVVANEITWMKSLSAAALGVNVSGNTVPPIAVAAPHLAWGALFLLVGLTTVVCLWSIALVGAVPLAIGRIAAAGSQAVVERSRSAGGSSAGVSSTSSVARREYPIPAPTPRSATPRGEAEAVQYPGAGPRMAWDHAREGGRRMRIDRSTGLRMRR